MKRLLAYLFGPRRPSPLVHDGHMVVPDIAVLDSHVLHIFYYAYTENQLHYPELVDDLILYCEGRLTPDAFISTWGPGKVDPSATGIAYRGMMA